ncbi:hypothetical protein ONZ45_g8141 [Pleurotus djamor]|nr:hypothetical protein ONZ45_g8141 [Pleurotus djamor]
MIPPIIPSSSPCEVAKPVPSSPLPQGHSQDSHVPSMARVQPTDVWTSLNTHSSPAAAEAFPAPDRQASIIILVQADNIATVTSTSIRLGTGETPTSQTLGVLQAAESRERVIVGLAASTSVLAGFIIGYLVHRVRRRFFTRQRTMGKLKIAECESKVSVTEEVPASPPQTRPINSVHSETENSSPHTVSPSSPQSLARDGTGSNDDPFDDIRRASKTSSLPSYRSEDPERRSSDRIE